jgi:NAD(P)-dependent dehydrogenase (short-subunit alcohol dehydrogenase family)
MTKLKNKVAVVTGGNSGIGYATAQALKEAGATVVITGRSEEKVREAAGNLGVKGITADVSKLAAIDSLVTIVEGEFGKVDILFINAGVFIPSPLGTLTEEAFDYQMDINFKGAVFTLEKFLPILNDGASVINLSSINAYTGMANTAIYAASKAAMNSFTRTAATELSERNIRVNAINPGPVSTPIFSKSGLSQDQVTSFAEAILNKIPMKRFGAPEDIAHLAVFLSSDDASFITGGEYNIDGGMTIKS